MYHSPYEKNGRYYNRYHQRIAKSLALMLMECDAAMRAYNQKEREEGK